MAKAASTGKAAHRRSATPHLPAARFRPADVTLAVLPPAERISLRAPAGSVAALVEGARRRPCRKRRRRSATKAGRTALWLGPDEWLVIDEAGKDPLADCAGRQGVAFGGRHLAPQCRHRGHRAGGRGGGQCRLPAGPVARRLPGRRLLAHHPRQGRDRAAAHGGRCIPRRMLAVVLRLCVHVPDGSGEGRGSIG